MYVGSNERRTRRERARERVEGGGGSGGRGGGVAVSTRFRVAGATSTCRRCFPSFFAVTGPNVGWAVTSAPRRVARAQSRRRSLARVFEPCPRYASDVTSSRSSGPPRVPTDAINLRSSSPNRPTTRDATRARTLLNVPDDRAPPKLALADARPSRRDSRLSGGAPRRRRERPSGASSPAPPGTRPRLAPFPIPYRRHESRAPRLEPPRPKTADRNPSTARAD